MLQHCSYNQTGLPVLSQHPYEYNEGNNGNQPPLNVDLNIQSQQSALSHPTNHAIPRSVGGHSSLLHSTAPIEHGINHPHQYPFSPIPISHQQYSPNLNYSTNHIYNRPENVGYLPNSPNMQPVQSCPGIPYISKTHQHHANARRSTPLSPHNELVPISNHSRGDSTSGPSRIMSPVQPKNDVVDVSDGMQSLQIGSEGADVKESGPPASSTAFISKLYHLCSHDDYHPYIRWNAAGDAFVLAHANVEFSSVILPRFFRHNNVSSFIRQLNLYNFTRLPTIKLLDTIDKTSNPSPACAYSGFSHPNFQRGDTGSLKLIKPKPSKSKAARKACKDASSIEDKNKGCRRSTPAKSKMM